jgi:ribosome-associated translation inhibitor RaiA
MLVQIHGKSLRLPETIRAVMERRIRSALGRFVGYVSQVRVGLADLNGPRGGVDKQCRLIVNLRPRGHIVIEAAHANAIAAVASAADRAGWNVSRKLKRRHDRKPQRPMKTKTLPEE